MTGDTLTPGMLGPAMPAKHTLHVALTEQLVRYVRDKVANGQHPTISHAVRASLLMLIEREEAERSGASVAPPPDRAGHG